MDHVTRKKKTEANLKTAFLLKICWIFARLELTSHVLTCSTFMYSWLVKTWSLTPAVLPRAGAISEPHDYKHKVPKFEGPLKNGF